MADTSGGWVLCGGGWLAGMAKLGFRLGSGCAISAINSVLIITTLNDVQIRIDSLG